MTIPGSNVRRWTILLTLGTLVLALAQVARSDAQTVPSLTLLSPADGATVDGPVTIRVRHSGIRFDGVVINKDPSPGVGHYHVNIDGKYAGLAVSDVLEIPNDAYPTITAGQHTIMVNLHENNHASTTPPVEHSIKLNFSKDVSIPLNTGGPLALTIVNPTGNVNVDAPLDVRVTHSGLRFDGVVINKDPSPGVGHYHINVDGKYAGLAVSNVIEIPNDAFPTLTVGQHTVMLNLHENNHAVTNPVVEHSFTINVTKEVTASDAPQGAATSTSASTSGPAATTMSAMDATATSGTAAAQTTTSATVAAQTTTSAASATAAGAAATGASAPTATARPFSKMPNTGTDDGVASLLTLALGLCACGIAALWIGSAIVRRRSES